MNSLLNQYIASSGKPYTDLKYLLDCFAEVLTENGEHDLVRYIPWIADEEPQTLDIVQNCYGQKVVHIFAISFQILNLCEVNWAVQERRRKGDDNDGTLVRGSWPNVLQNLKAGGSTEKQIAEALAACEVEPVLTAHPTEAKRAVVLKYYRELYLLIVKLENPVYNGFERVEIRNEVKTVLQKLWFIDDIFLEKPNIETELSNVLHYLVNVFPEVVEYNDLHFKQAWQAMGYSPQLINDYTKLPKITFGTWVGGDRDGHPFVTPEITRSTLKKLRNEAIRLVHDKLNGLADAMSIYTMGQTLNKAFEIRLGQLIEEAEPLKTKLTVQYFTNEPFRLFVKLLIDKLPIKKDKLSGETKLYDRSHTYSQSKELLQDLLLLHSALTEFGAGTMALTEVGKVCRHIDLFGFHLAHLDIRQNSVYHEKALIGLLTEANIVTDANGSIPKLFLYNELAHNRPFTNNYGGTCVETQSVLGCLRVVNEHMTTYGPRAFGSLIVSMTRRIDDLLIVYLLAREAGLMHRTPYGLTCKMPVVPLFETIDDLNNCGEIMDEFLAHPVTVATMNFIAEQRGYKKPVVEVMLGYSDSNKDGGIIASNRYLNHAQQTLKAVAVKHGVEIKAFHGKGGTISRGSGPTHWFLSALPKGTLNGKIRLTEQGETIERKYANKLNAAFNLELLVAGTLQNTLVRPKEHSDINKDAERIMLALSDAGYEKYQQLTTNKSFIKYYEQATPIDIIEMSKIGSRPSRRTNQRTLADLRAIPWVFSWSQSRTNITGWYGLGTALSALKTNDAESYQMLKSMVKYDDMIRYLLTNIDTSLASTDEEIINLYASLVVEPDVRAEVQKLIIDELQLTRQCLLDVLGRTIEERRRNHFQSTRLRAKPLRLLHEAQVEAIRYRRVQAENGDPESKHLNIVLLKTINAIANALGTTG